MISIIGKLMKISLVIISVFLYCAIPNTITITQFYIQDIEKDVHLERIKIQMSD